MRRRHKQVEAATRELAATLQRNPTEAEVAQKLGIDQERWRSMMLDLRNVGLVSASTRTNESDDLPAPDFPCKPESHPDSICGREQLRGVLGGLLGAKLLWNHQVCARAGVCEGCAAYIDCELPPAQAKRAPQTGG